MKFDISWFQLHFQMDLPSGGTGACFVMDYYCQNSLLAASLQRDVVQNHAKAVEIPVLRAMSDAAGQ